MRALLVAGGVSPERVELWLPPLIFAADRFEINSRLRRIHWLATLVHESGAFRTLEEDLHYRAITLLKLFPLTPHRPWGFTAQDAADYAMKPERIANRIYADRMGNGNQGSGDGWLYRGRGPIQITFHDNYVLAAKDCGVDVVREPDLLLVPTNGAFAGAGFWTRRGCNEAADEDDVVKIRHRVNGGEIGLKEVKLLVDRMKHA